MAGKPKRLLDPSAGLSAPAPSMAQNPYIYNEQVNFIKILINFIKLIYFYKLDYDCYL